MKLIKECPIEKLIPFEDNPRLNDQAIPALVKSIEKFGFINPIICDEQHKICAGHTRYKAALKLGLATVPVLMVPDLVGDKFKGYNIADNQTATLAEWDEDQLASLLADLDQSDFDLGSLGFESDNLADILARMGVKTGGKTDPDAVPDPPATPVSKTGDLWLLGQHRLLCGDVRESEDVARLIAGERIDVCLTDPPYCSGGFQEAGKSAGSVGTDAVHRPIANDRLSTRGFQTLLNIALSNVGASCLYVFTDWRMWTYLFDLSEASGYGVRSMIVWNKGTAGMGRGWRTQHELILWACKDVPPYPDKFGGAGNVIDMPRTGNDLHTTQKPVELIAALLANTPFAKTIADPCLGSGTTIIAAEQLGRKCYGMEIDPIYCDVAVKRWEDFTGLKAELCSA